jgi:hypothetical protein
VTQPISCGSEDNSIANVLDKYLQDVARQTDRALTSTSALHDELTALGEKLLWMAVAIDRLRGYQR